jgi:hypothetical protein
MNKFYVLAFVLFLSACSAQPSASQPGSGCDSFQPAQADIEYVLNFGKELFSETDWQRSYTVEEFKAYVSWTHRSVSAISDVSILLFCDEGGTQDIGWYFNDDSVQTMFTEYDQSLLVKSCAKDDFLLYEFEAIEENIKYDIRFWAQTLNKSRVLTMMLVFPRDESNMLEQYGQQFFPELSSCP